MRYRPVLLLVVALFAACGDGTADATTTTELATTSTPATTVAAPTATTETATSRPATSTTTTVTTNSSTVADAVIDVSVTGGTVEGGGRVSVSLGEEVTIRVTTDTADEVHVHGYDLFADVAPGEPAEVTFVADIPGVFEVELESSHLPLLTLAVEV